MIKCPSCGFSNDDNCTFCAICGSSVTQDDFYVRNTTTASFSVENLTKKLISKDKQENGKTKSFKKLDKATIAREAAKIELNNNDVKEYKGSSKKNSDKQNKKDTSKTYIKTNSNDKIEVKNTESNKEIALDNSKQDTSAVNKDIKNNTDLDKPKNNNSKPSIEKSNENANSKAEETKEEPNTKAEKTKEATNAEESKKTKQELNSAENKPTSSDIKQEEKQIQSVKAKEEEIPDSAKGSTDGELYRILSKFFFDTKNETSLFKQDDIDENCTLALISYIPFLFFIPMIIKPCSGYLRYHGIQGLTMFISFVALEFFNIIMGAIFNSIFNEMTGVILTVIITVLINLTVLLLISIGIANAVKGAARELPIIGKYKLLKQYIY